MKILKVNLRKKDGFIFGTTPSNIRTPGSIMMSPSGEFVVDKGETPGEYIIFYDYHLGYISDDEQGGEIKEIKRDEFDYMGDYSILLDEENVPMMINGKVVLMSSYGDLPETEQE